MTDTAKLPNFDALDDWIRKLRGWSEEAVSRLRDLQSEVDHLQIEVAGLEGQLEFWRGRYEEVVEMVQDIDRGLLTVAELSERLKSVVV